MVLQLLYWSHGLLILGYVSHRDVRRPKQHGGALLGEEVKPLANSCLQFARHVCEPH